VSGRGKEKPLFQEAQWFPNPRYLVPALLSESRTLKMKVLDHFERPQL
jgi:hypothetical protein